MRTGIGIATVVAIGLIWSVAVMSQVDDPVPAKKVVQFSDASTESARLSISRGPNRWR